MKKSAICAITLWTLLPTVYALADEKGEKYEDNWHGMMTEEHKMHQETLKMLKETMGILRGMNHKPSEAEQKRLRDMEVQLDKIMAREEELMKSHMMPHEKGGKMPMKGGGMM